MLEALEEVTKLAARSAALTLAANVDVAIAVSDKKAAAWKTWAAQLALLYAGWKVAQAWGQTEVTWGSLAKIPEVGRVTSLVFAWLCVWLAGTRLGMGVVWHLGRDVRKSVDWELEPEVDEGADGTEPLVVEAPEGEKANEAPEAPMTDMVPVVEAVTQTDGMAEGQNTSVTEVSVITSS